MGEPTQGYITQLLDGVRQGQPDARGRLWELVYGELHRLAEAQMVREDPGRTLQPTAVVHEAYLRLFGSSGASEPSTSEGGPLPDGRGSDSTPEPWFENRAHFFAAAAKAMRRILVDDARRRGRLKRGGAGYDALQRPADDEPESPTPRRRRVNLDDCADPAGDGAPDPADLLAIEEALGELEREDPDLAGIVELRFFAGLSVEQTGEVLGIATRTVEKRWRLARAWLHEALS